MSYTTSIGADIGTAGLTLLAAITNSNGTPHTTVRDLAVTEIAQGQYQLNTTAIPYGYNGVLIFYTTALGVAANWNGVSIQAQTDVSILTPMQYVKAAVFDSATVSSETITLADGTTITKSGGNRVTVPA